MPAKFIIGLDYSHNNKLTLEASSYSDFTQFLFTSGYKLGKIQAGYDSLSKIKNYDMIILSTPNNSKLELKEIEVLEQYVKTGGSLLIVSSSGGDYSNRTNLNELTQKFGFTFVYDEINDSMNYINLQKRPLISKFIPHPITEQLKKIVFSSACSLDILDFIEDEENIKIDIVASAGLNCWRKRYDGKEWVEEDCPKIPLIVAINYFKGRIVGFGNLSMFSSLGREYGFSAFDNDILIANILKWLTVKGVSEGKVLTVNLNLELYYWAESIIKDQNWENISDIINLSLKYFKDNYKKIIEDIKKIRLEKLKRRKEYEQKKVRMEKESTEDKILEMVSVRKKEDLEDIMSALEEVTGEKFEVSLDFDKIDLEQSEEKIITEKKDKGKEEDGKKEEDIIDTGRKAKESEKINDMVENNVDEEIKIELEKQWEELKESLDKEVEKEEELIMVKAKEEIEKEIEKKIENNQLEKLEQEFRKQYAQEIKKEKEKIIEKAKENIDKESEKIFEKVKEEVEKFGKKKTGEDLKKIIGEAKKKFEEERKKIIEKAKEEMEKDREKRIQTIKEREIQIVKENQKFFDDIMNAVDMFSGPILEGDKKKEKKS
ncbi:MAG: hypothetical protein ACTSPD_01350 [Promethearchaeota archaeon]